MDRNEYNTAKDDRTKSDRYVEKLAEFLDGKEYLIGEYHFDSCSFLDYLSLFFEYLSRELTLAGYPIEIPAGNLEHVTGIFQAFDNDQQYPDYVILHNNGYDLAKGEYKFTSTIPIGTYRWSILATVSTSGSAYRYHSISSRNEQIILHPGNVNEGSGTLIEKSSIKWITSHHLKAVLLKKVAKDQ